MSKAYQTKQECREDLERVTNPDQPLLEQAALMTMAPLWGALLAMRNALRVLKGYTGDDHDFPCEEHRAIALSLLDGMPERMTAFELEVMNVLTDLAWEVNECECDHCMKVQAEADVEDKASKAKYN